jgi:hypothetical protein
MSCSWYESNRKLSKRKTTTMNVEELAVALEELIYEIQQEIEYLETTEGDSIECIGVENLEGILSRFFGLKIKISQP